MTDRYVLAVLRGLPADGTSVGNGRLRQQLGLDEETYSQLTDALKTMGYVARGRGGSVSLTPEGRAYLGEVDPQPEVEPVSVPTPAPQAVAPRAPRGGAKTKTGGPLGFEDALWKAADKLRGSMDSSEYKHVVLGLVFLKYIDVGFRTFGRLRG